MKADLSGEFQLVSSGRMAPSFIHKVEVIGEILLLDRLCKFVRSYLIRNPYPALFHSKGALSSGKIDDAYPLLGFGEGFRREPGSFRCPSHHFAHPWGAESLIGADLLFLRLDWSITFLSREFSLMSAGRIAPSF
jgi:hypothetical protein